MTRYLLDTDALIDFSKGSEPATSQILSWVDAGETLAVCAICLAEFSAGLSMDEVSHWEAFLFSLTYFEISSETALRAGQYRYRFSKFGKSLTIADSLFAAVARDHGATLVTGNVRDFPMEDIVLHSIR